MQQEGSPTRQQLGDQIREAVQRQVEAARAQAEAAADQAEAAADQAIDLEVDANPQITPGVAVRPHTLPDLPPQVVDITLMFFLTVFAIIVGFPIARAVARWIDRRGQQPRVPADLSSQISQIAQSVDAMAIEIERISEGQRFTTKLLSEQHERRGALASGGQLPSV